LLPNISIVLFLPADTQTYLTTMSVFETMESPLPFMIAWLLLQIAKFAGRFKEGGMDDGNKQQIKNLVPASCMFCGSDDPLKLTSG